MMDKLDNRIQMNNETKGYESTKWQLQDAVGRQQKSRRRGGAGALVRSQRNQKPQILHTPLKPKKKCRVPFTRATRYLSTCSSVYQKRGQKVFYVWQGRWGRKP